MAPRWMVMAGAVTALALAACTGSTTTPAPSGSATQAPVPSAQDLASAVESVFTSRSGRFAGFDDVRALLVVVDGEPLLERFAGAERQDAHHVFSVTKSVMSILVGIAIDEGHLPGVGATMAELLPEYLPVMSPEAQAITLEQVLTMTAGLRASTPEITPSTDLVLEAVGDRFLETPGERFSYSDVGAHLLSAILVRSTGRPVLDFAREHLFDPLGIVQGTTEEPVLTGARSLDGVTGHAWGVDPQGRHLGFTGLWMTPADMLALGELMLAGGEWHGERIVSAEWVESSTSRQVELEDGVGYGYLWWTSTADGHPAFLAVGFGGQLVEVVPALDMVVVAATAVPEHPTMQGERLEELVDEVIAPAVGS